MAFGFGFALTAIAKAVGFSPLNLFTSGAQGAWYDPSDYTTLFEDSAGTIPITSPLEKPVGLMLDKSRGLTLGSELVVNGDFSSGTTGWSGATYGATLSAVSGELLVTRTAANGRGSFTFTTVAGRAYLVTATYRKVSGTTDASVGWSNNNYGGSASWLPANNTSSPVTKTGVFFATGTQASVSVGNDGGASGDTFAADNISVRELPGNHAYQSTSASRPVLSARYNLLTKTAQLNDAAWSQTNVTTPAADTILETVTSGTHRLQQTISVGATKYRFYAEFYPAGRNSAALQLYDITAGITKAHAVFSLTGNGSVLSNLQGSSGVTPLPDGWYSCYVESTVDFTAGNLFAWVAVTDGTTQSYAGDVTKGVKARNTDLRPTNAGVNLPPYQRVTTSTDYDTAGFPAYLKFDGIDDSLATGNIDFTATDKMTVFAGVRKLSDAANGVVIESSTDAGANNGAFEIRAPFFPGTNYSFRSGGTVRVIPIATKAAPTTDVVSGVSDISGDKAILRINGAQAAINTADQGTGNYGNYPLYIGRRGGTTLPFNGRLYSLVVCGKLASAAEITATEAYINQKTRAY